MLMTILLVVLIVMLFGAFPTWPHSAGWGYSPVSIILIILLLVVVFGGRF